MSRVCVMCLCVFYRDLLLLLMEYVAYLGRALRMADAGGS